jgi:hypothetical protein
MEHPLGESKRTSLRVDFDHRLKLEFHGSKITSDAGLLAYRELDDIFGLTDMVGDVLSDSRTCKNGRHGMTGQFRQSVFGHQINRMEREIKMCRAKSAPESLPNTHCATVVGGLEQATGKSRLGNVGQGQLSGAIRILSVP